MHSDGRGERGKRDVHKRWGCLAVCNQIHQPTCIYSMAAVILPNKMIILKLLIQLRPFTLLWIPSTFTFSQPSFLHFLSFCVLRVFPADWIIPIIIQTWASIHHLRNCLLIPHSVEPFIFYQNLEETPVQFLGCKDPLEKGNATHSSILAWRIPWTV